MGQAMAKAGRVILLAILMVLCLGPSALAEVKAYLFWQQGCPYCERAKVALAEIGADVPDFTLVQIELGVSAENDALFEKAVERLGIQRPAVPLFVIGDQAVLGFSTGTGTAMRYRGLISGCSAVPCIDLLAADRVAPRVAGEVPLAQPIEVPFLGAISPATLSLPILTVTLAAVDGFNPCAMWVLAILIGLLLGVEDRWRMWTLGLVFLAATGVMYFAVMAAWLNVILWIGALSWIRLAIGAVAIGAGGYYLREYWTNPEGICRVTPSARRKTIIERFQALVEEPSLLAASLGIALLAIGVNLIELVCSAGIPAIFTQMLAMREVPTATYYGYLMLYLTVFLLDDTAIFVTSMIVLRRVAATGRFARLSHLIGGVVLLALGAVMVLRPDLLA